MVRIIMYKYLNIWDHINHYDFLRGSFAGIICIPKIGVILTIGMTILKQLMISCIVNDYGLFGKKKN